MAARHFCRIQALAGSAVGIGDPVPDVASGLVLPLGPLVPPKPEIAKLEGNHHADDRGHGQIEEVHWVSEIVVLWLLQRPQPPLPLVPDADPARPLVVGDLFSCARHRYTLPGIDQSVNVMRIKGSELPVCRNQRSERKVGPRRN
jgi:hypothetical protein